MTPRGVSLLALLALCGCGRSAAPAESGPVSKARELFVLAALDEPTDDRLLELFDPGRVGDDRAALLDALDRLDDVSPASDVEVTELSGPDEVVVDLTAELPGGGSAGYSVQLRAETDGSWRIDWFLGPGVEWPASQGKDEGLTVSAPPR